MAISGAFVFHKHILLNFAHLNFINEKKGVLVLVSEKFDFEKGICSPFFISTVEYHGWCKRSSIIRRKFYL